MKNLKAYYRPKTLEEAHRLLMENERSKVLGGGTTIVKIRDARVEVLVDIKYAGIDYINVDGDVVRIGAATRIQDIYTSPQLQEINSGIYSKVASAVGSTLTRNLITLGGNIAQLFYWSDMPVALLLTDSEVEIYGKTPRTLSAKEFFAKNPKLILETGDIIKEVSFKKAPAARGFAFTKFAKTKFDFSIINAGAALTIEDGKIRDSRVVVSALTTLPQRVAEAEDFLDGKEPTGENFEKAGKIAAESIDITGDFRISKEYRKEVLPVLIRRTFEDALKQIKGAN